MSFYRVINCKRCKCEIIGDKRYSHYVPNNWSVGGINIMHQIEDYCDDEKYW